MREASVKSISGWSAIVCRLTRGKGTGVAHGVRLPALSHNQPQEDCPSGTYGKRMATRKDGYKGSYVSWLKLR